MIDPVNYNKQNLYLDCTCGCSNLKFEYWEDSIVISHLISSYQAEQYSGWDKFTKTIKMLWFIVQGKEYRLYEIVIDSKSKLKEFKEFVNLMDESKLFYD